MKKVLMGLAAAGLLFSAPAFSQNTETKTPSTDAPAATTTAPAAAKTTAPATTAKPSGQNQAAPAGQRRQQSGNTERGERRGRGASRIGISVRIGERGGWRHRHHYRSYEGGCRTIIIKKRYHGHRVIKRIRRCR